MSGSLPAKLSYEIRHPFHSSHPLSLYTSYYLGGQLTACDECRDICHGFIYFCEQCNFKLDMKCAALTTHKIGVLEEKKMDRVTELHHFTQPHKLVLANCNYPEYKTQCSICKLLILGPAYFCPTCNYILHESCLRLPQKIQVPFHLNHMSVSRLLPTFGSSQRCYACPLYLEPGGFVYSCEHCDFNIHATCANSLRRRLKCEFHPNDLYYFGRNHKSLFDYWGIDIDCYECDESCKGEPRYYDLKCDISFHLKCVPIPDIEERIPNDNIYYCEECNGQTIAHIECVLAKVEDNIEIRKNNSEERLRKKLENLVASVWSDNSSLQLQAITRFTKLLSKKYKASIEEVIQAGVVPRFVELLGSPSDGVREQAVLALRNIVGDSLRCRDLVLGHGALLPLLAQLNQHAELYMLRNATWTLATFCKPPFDQVKLVLPTLARLIHSNDDDQVLTNACWALSYLSDGTNDEIQIVIEAGVCGRLVEPLMHPSPSVITPALYTVGHIVSEMMCKL
ncbi:hypothetical protein Gogos_015584, partial [Gossypium gossypioides]|nr:hypothetical protein [Gossypium gossypioides]